MKIPVYVSMASVLLLGPAAAQSPDESMSQAVAEFDASMRVIADFVKGVEFDEGDIRSMLEYWPEMDDLDVMSADDDPDSSVGLAKDIQKILADPEYLAWARKRGLDPESWLRKSMRVTTAMMTRELEGQRETMASQRESYAQMVEESCAQVDEEACEQMRGAMNQSMAMGEAMMAAAAKLPPPTAGEIALLQQYGPELQDLMTADEGYDEYSDEYGEEYLEDDG